jgi:uncharacterized protein (TIGR03435 family)
MTERPDFARHFFPFCVLLLVPSVLTLGDAAQAGFEVASVRRTSPHGNNSVGFKAEGRGGPDPEFQVEHGRFTATNVALYGLIVKAFGLTTCCPFAGSCVLLTGGPAWLGKDGFTIRAKAPDGSPDYNLVQFPNGRAPQLQAMLRLLLEDRFHLKVHSEKRQPPVYVLAKGNREPKLKRADKSDESRIAFRPVLQSNGDNTAIREQLGLLLVPSKAPVEVIVIDHIEQPSAN